MASSINASLSAGVITTADTSGVLNIQTAGVTAISIDASQAVTMAGRTTNPTTISVGAATPSTSGAGITFPATQSASGNANTLDDYEEGTWTPTIGNQSAVYTTQAGRYTKVGNLVTVWAMIVISSKSGNGAEASIQGLPFASSSTLGTLYPVTGCIGRTYTPGGLMPTNNANFLSIESTIAYIRYPIGSGASLTVNDLGASGGIGLFASYYV